MWRVLATIGLAAALEVSFSGGADAAKRSKSPKVPRLKVTSEQIARRGTIANEQVTNFPGFGCNGGNVSP